MPLTPQRRSMRQLALHIARLAIASTLATQAVAWADDTTQLQEAASLADRYVQPSLQFAPCPDNATLECASLRVPVDYRSPWAGGVNLAVVRAPASQPGRRIGVLMVNPGGPGESGVDFVRQGVNVPAFQRLRQRFDIVSFDVRGSHRSQAVTCQAPLPPTLEVAQIDEFSKAMARNCVQQHGALVTSMSTTNTARDVEILRRSLRERQLSFVGQSYGGVLAAVYASMYPHHLRAVLIDASVTPNFRDGQVEFRTEQLLAFETVFQRLDQLCRADAVCRLRTAGVSNTLTALKARLDQAPVAGPGGLVLTSGNLTATVAALLSNEAAWPSIVDALADANAGNPALLFQLVAAHGSGGGIGGGALTLAPITIIRCNDFGTRRSAADYLPAGDAAGAVSSRVTSRITTLVELAPCAAWPEAEVPRIRKVAGPQGVPVLLFGNQFDPNTPLAWTRSMAAMLGAERQVVRYQGGGHRVYAIRGSACIDALGDAFLFDLKLPPEGTSCAALPVAFRPGT